MFVRIFVNIKQYEIVYAVVQSARRPH